MAEDLAPGVFVEETSYRSRSIPGVPTWTWPLIAVLVALAIARFFRHRGILR